MALYICAFHNCTRYVQLVHLLGLDSFCSFLLDEAGQQPVAPAAQLLTPFNVYDLHDK
jgi:hypothetical protein